MDAIDPWSRRSRALFGGVVDADAFDGAWSSPARRGRGASLAGKRAPAASSAMRCMPWCEVMGMMPAMMGTLMPAMRQRSRKSRKSWLSKNNWVQM